MNPTEQPLSLYWYPKVEISTSTTSRNLPEERILRALTEDPSGIQPMRLGSTPASTFFCRRYIFSGPEGQGESRFVMVEDRPPCKRLMNERGEKGAAGKPGVLSS